MATFTAFSMDQARALGRAFGLEIASVKGIPAGSVNSNYRLTTADGTALFARVYEEQDRVGAESESRLLDHLARNGVATPRPLPRRDGQGFTFSIDARPTASNDATTRPVALFPWREGEILCQARVTPDA